MNPLAFLFESISSLNDETELLEACDWNEERLEYVKSKVNLYLEEILSNSVSPLTSSEIVKNLSEKLQESIEDKESQVCLHIFKRNLKNFLELNVGEDYEN